MDEFKVGDVVVILDEMGYVGEPWNPGAIGIVREINHLCLGVEVGSPSGDGYPYSYLHSSLEKVGVLE